MFKDVEKIIAYSESGEVDETINYITLKHKNVEEPEKIEGFDKCWDILLDYTVEKGKLSIKELPKEVFEIKKIAKEEERDIPREILHDGASEEDEEETEERKGHGVRNSVIAIVTALTLLGAGYFFGKNGFKGFNNQRTGTPKNNDKEITTQVPDNKKIITKVDGKESVVNNGSNYQDNLKEVYAADNMTGRVQRFVVFDPMTNKEFYNNLDDLNLYLEANVKEVCDLLEGGRMTGDEYILSFKELFEVGTKDYYAVGYIEELRNQIVHRAYDQNCSQTTSDVKDFLDAYINFCLNDRVLNINSQRISYRDLSPIARYLISGLGAMGMQYPIDYSNTIGSKELKREEMFYDVKTLWSTATMNLENSVINK